MTLVFPAMIDHNDYRKSHTIILSIPITPDANLLLPVRKKNQKDDLGATVLYVKSCNSHSKLRYFRLPNIFFRTYL